MKKYISQKWQAVKRSRSFLFLLGLIIGATSTYCYLETQRLFAEYNQAIIVFNRAEAREIPMSQDMGAVVTTAAHLDSESPQGFRPAGTEEPDYLPASPELLIRQYDWDADYAIKIMNCESSGDPSRIGDKHLKRPSFGLFQVNTYFNPQYDETKLLEPAYNISAAYEIYKQGGWGRWSCSRII